MSASRRSAPSTSAGPAWPFADAAAASVAADAAGPASAPAAPVRSRRSRTPVPATPLGSLTQSEQRVEAVCAACGSHRVTRLSMTLTDGTPVAFTSCHRCERRSWQGQDDDLSVDDVLDRARKSV